MDSRKSITVSSLTAVLALLALLACGCQGMTDGGQATEVNRTIVVHSFSIGEEVMTDGLFPAFQNEWRERTGQAVTFQGVFTSSEQVADSIIAGGAGDIAIFSSEQHATWLRINNMVETDWHTFPQEGVISCSPIVLVVRPGNPFGIHGWSDLTRSGLAVIHPNLCTSGGAQWAVLAEYGTFLLDSNGDEAYAWEELEQVWGNVISCPATSREAMREFLYGTGDVLVTYEQDALLAQSRGAAFEIVMPNNTIMSEHLVVIVDKNVREWERDVVEAFVAFLWSEQAQSIFTRYYFRSASDELLNEAVPEFQPINNSFTVDELGGWAYVYPNVIHRTCEQLLPNSR
ncbi:MAG: sulfate ABC transporter substrate-binding protein [Anaerolineae bacterium]|nr:sulfate ABC transporter substrate-binding protein [Anaerolineae bacterium]